jgi:hypothetical protein
MKVLDSVLNSTPMIRLIWWFCVRIMGIERATLGLAEILERKGAFKQASDLRIEYSRQFGRLPGTSNVNPSEGSANAGGNL